MTQHVTSEDASQLKDCYVCLEPTVGRSPCLCQSPIHTSCLLQLVNSNPEHTTCSICKHPLHGFYLSGAAQNIDSTLAQNTAAALEENYVQMAAHNESKCVLTIIRIIIFATLVFVITYVVAFCSPSACRDLHPSSYFIIVFFLVMFAAVFCMPCHRRRPIVPPLRRENIVITV